MDHLRQMAGQNIEVEQQRRRIGGAGDRVALRRLWPEVAVLEQQVARLLRRPGGTTVAAGIIDEGVIAAAVRAEWRLDFACVDLRGRNTGEPFLQRCDFGLQAIDRIPKALH